MSDLRDPLTGRSGTTTGGDYEVRRTETAAARRPTNPRSTASVAGHPLHPMLIPFPIAFFVATFVCDLVYWSTRNDGWAYATLYLLGAGLIIAALAATAGLIDFLGDQRIQNLTPAWHHMIGNVIAVLFSLWNWLRRYKATDLGDAVLPLGLILSLIVVLICSTRAGRAGRWFIGIASPYPKTPLDEFYFCASPS